MIVESYNKLVAIHRHFKGMEEYFPRELKLALIKKYGWCIADRIELRQIVWDRLGYEPYKEQREVHDALLLGGVRHAILCTARQIGKSTIMVGLGCEGAALPRTGGLKVFNEIGVYAPETERGRPIYDKLLYYLRDRERTAGGPLLGSDFKFDGKENKLVYPWGAVIHLFSGQRPNQVRGKALRLFLWDEADYNETRQGVTPIDFFNFILIPALRSEVGSAAVASSPDGFKTMYYLKKESDTDKTIRFFNWDSWKNPHTDKEILDKEYARAFKENPTLARQEYFGEFVGATGGVYASQYQPTKLIERNGEQVAVSWHMADLPIIPRLPLYVGIDWGERATAFTFLQFIRSKTDIMLSKINVLKSIQFPGDIDTNILKRFLYEVEWFKRKIYPYNDGDVQINEVVKRVFADPRGGGRAINLFMMHGIPMYRNTKGKGGDIAIREDKIKALRGWFLKTYKKRSGEIYPAIRLNRHGCYDLHEDIINLQFKNAEKWEKKGDNTHRPDSLEYAILGIYITEMVASTGGYVI